MMMPRVRSAMLRVCSGWVGEDVEFHEGWDLFLCGSGGGGSGVDGSGGGIGDSGGSSGVGDSSENIEKIVYRSGGGGGRWTVQE